MKTYPYLILVLTLFLLFNPCLTLRSNHQAFATCKNTTYQYSTFALTWVGQYCTQTRCAKNWKDVWDNASFAIHGYWPSSTDLAYLSCQQQDGYDRFCYQDYTFNQSKLANLKNDLNKVWPQIGNIKNFWEYEWDKHGTCYLKLTLDKYNSKKLTQDQIFYKYFEGAIKKFKTLKITTLNKFNFDSKKQFAKYLNLQEGQFSAVCGDDNQLDEIRICYDLNTPQSQKVITCPGKKPKQCYYPILLKGE